MKVQTGIQAGITPGDVVDQASNAVASAAHTVSGVASDVLHGAGDLSNNLGITDLAKKLWYWPFNTPGTPSA